MGPWEADLENFSIGNKSGIILDGNLARVFEENAEEIIALGAQAPALKEIAEAFLQYLQVRGDDTETILINHIKHILNKTKVEFLKR